MTEQASEQVSPAQARAEIVRQLRGTALYLHFIQLDILRRLHAKQRAVIDMVLAGVRFIAAECGRRAGKTHLDAAAIVLKLITAKRGQEVVFVAPTLARGKELIWGELERMLDEYGLRPEDGWKRTAASGKLRTPVGAMFRIVGLDNKKQIGKVARGGNTVLLITDETQEFPHLLEQLLNAAGPALAQSRGCCLASGTPTKNESDYWAKICDGAEGFEHVHWTLRDNPFLGRDPDELLAEERKRKGWTEDHPEYVREYLGRRCRDASNMVLELDPKRNVVQSITGYAPPAARVRAQRVLGPWRFFLGIDFGLGDKTAWVMLAAPLDAREVYAVHCEQDAGLTWDEVADRTKRLCQLYQPQGVVGDSASGGAQFLHTFNMRYGREVGIAARSATKHDKVASISTMNTELRTGRLRFLAPQTSELVAEASALQWDPEDRTSILEGSAYPEDLFDALRYAFNDFWAFAHPKRGRQETEEERRIRERNEREQARQASEKRLRLA